MIEPRRYRVLGAIGTGGFGTVYRAEMLASGGFRKPVALKMLRSDLVDHDEVLQRLRDEARMLGLVQHPAIVGVDTLVRLDGRWAVVMEYVEGVGVNELLDDGPLSWPVALEVVEAVAGALHAAWGARSGDHHLGLIHRDIKPSNVLVTKEGRIKLLDFGIARAEFDEREAETRSLLFGSPAYMAPERWELDDLPAGDVYSLGAVTYEMLTARPLGRTTAHPGRHDLRVEGALSSLGDELPSSVQMLLRSMLAYEPGDRPSARNVERICRRLVVASDGPWLREWAEDRVPQVLAARPSVDDDPLSGATLVEPTGSAEVLDGAFPPDRAGRRHWRLAVAGLGIMAGLGACAGAWALVGALELATAVRPDLEPPPQVSPEPPRPAPPDEPPVETPSEASAPPQADPDDALPTALAPRRSASPPRDTPKPPSMGTVVVTGDAIEVWLIGEDGRLRPGEVPPGTYDVEAHFHDRGRVRAGQVAVSSGRTVRVSCDAAFSMCRSE